MKRKIITVLLFSILMLSACGQIGIPEEKGEPVPTPKASDAVVEEKGEPVPTPRVSDAVVEEKGEPVPTPKASDEVAEEKGEPVPTPKVNDTVTEKEPSPTPEASPAPSSEPTPEPTPTPVPTPSPTPEPPTVKAYLRPGECMYVVNYGDSVSGISGLFGIEQEKLCEWNEIEDPDKIYVGMVMMIRMNE